MLLALDTATDTCSVALCEGGVMRALKVVRRKRAHSEMLMVLVRDVLEETGVALGEVEAVAVSLGPGSYTGLRIGLSAAKGLCAATDAALIGVPTLEALAEAARASAQVGDVLVAAMPARRGEVYAAAFAATPPGDALARRGEATALRLSDAPIPAHEAHRDVLPVAASWLSERAAHGLPGEPNTAAVWLVGDAAEALHPFLPHARPLGDAEALADAVAACAARRHARGEADDLAALSPLYLKAFAARASVNPLSRLRPA